MIVPIDRDSGEKLLTAEQAANVRAVATGSWHRQVARGSYPPPDGHVGRTPVWLESTVRQMGKSHG